MKVTHELLMSKKCKTKLKMMMAMVDLMLIGVMMMMMMVMLKLKMMMIMMIMMMVMVIVLTMKVIFFYVVTANGDVSNIKPLIGETQWCFLRHKTLQVGEEITFTFCTTTSKQNDCTVLCETTVSWPLDLITFNGPSTQFTEIHVGEAILQTSWQCTSSLHTLTVRLNKVGG